jgi:hypothetical protein
MAHAPLIFDIRRKKVNAVFNALPLIVGLSFTTVGALKIYGRTKGIIGGGGKPASARLVGSCPTWSRSVNLTLTWLSFAIGVAALFAAIVTMLSR